VGLIPVDPKWAKVPVAQWLAAFQKPSKGLLDEGLSALIDELTEHFPQPGYLTYPETPVILRKGRHIAPHKHPEHLIIYFPLGNPAKLITAVGEFTPIRNSAIYLAPNILHSVERVTTKAPRLSLALRWETG